MPGLEVGGVRVGLAGDFDVELVVAGDEGGARAATLGSIVITDPVVKAFLAQLGALLADPWMFRDEPEFDPGTAQAGER